MKTVKSYNLVSHKEWINIEKPPQIIFKKLKWQKFA